MNNFIIDVGINTELPTPQEVESENLLENADAYIAIFSENGKANFAFQYKEGADKHLGVLLHYIRGNSFFDDICPVIAEKLEDSEELFEFVEELNEQYRPNVTDSAIIQPISFGRSNAS